VFLDFGRELTGRVEIVSDSDTPAVVTIQMGESESEALRCRISGSTCASFVDSFSYCTFNVTDVVCVSVPLVAVTVSV
jgi:hypothetical protein